MMGRIDFRIAKVLASVLAVLFSTELAAQAFGFKQSLAQYISSDRSISGFYRARDYGSFWTGPTEQERARLEALITAFADAEMHGLPKARFNAETVLSKLRGPIVKVLWVSSKRSSQRRFWTMRAPCSQVC